MIIIFHGPNDFIEDSLVFFGFYKTETWVLLVAGSNGWSNYRHQVLKYMVHKYYVCIITTKSVFF